MFPATNRRDSKQLKYRSFIIYCRKDDEGKDDAIDYRCRLKKDQAVEPRSTKHPLFAGFRCPICSKVCREPTRLSSSFWTAASKVIEFNQSIQSLSESSSTFLIRGKSSSASFRVATHLLFMPSFPASTIFVLNWRQARRRRKEVICLSLCPKQYAEESLFLGMRFFYKRALHLLSSMFTMEEDYVVAAFLHLNYKQLRGATHSQLSNCHASCRMSLFPGSSLTGVPSEVEDEQLHKNGKHLMTALMDKSKKKKKVSPSDDFDRYNQFHVDDNDQFPNSLDFWKGKDNQVSFPNLSRLALRCLSVSCSLATVERQFSAAGQLMTQRRSSLDPSTVNNIIFLRAMEKNSSVIQWHCAVCSMQFSRVYIFFCS